MSKSKIIGIIGAGDIGFNVAEILALLNYQVIIYNRYHEVDNHPSPYWLSKMGKVMDLSDGLEVDGCGKVALTSNLSDLKNVDFLVITAGSKRGSTDETREDLAAKNAGIVASFAELIATGNIGLTLILSNPVDFLTGYLIEQVAKLTNQNPNDIASKIVGVSYVDTMRLKALIRDFLQHRFPQLTNPEIKAAVIGEHGPAMLPVMSNVTVNDQELSHYANENDISYIKQQTILRGNDIIKLTGTSSVKGPAHAALLMIDQITKNQNVTIPCSYYQDGIAIGRMVAFEDQQAKAEIPTALTTEEGEEFKASIASVKKQFKLILSKIT